MGAISEVAQKILAENRLSAPTISSLSEQMNAIARVLLEQSVVNDTVSSLQSQLQSLTFGDVSLAQTRTLNTDFVISTTRNAIVFYTIELTASRLLTGSDSAQVDLLVNGAIIGTVKNLLTVTLALGVGITNTHQKILMGFVPPNYTANLTSSGTGASSIVQCMEILI